jgi:vancomycin resistance protein YoaR
MAFVSVPRPQRPPRSPVPGQILASVTGGLTLFFLVIGLVTSVYQVLFSGRIFPGITMAGVDLSSMTPDQATNALQQRLTYPASGQVVFRDGDRVWATTPAELGMSFDAGMNVQQAYDIGRQGGWLTNLASQLNAWQGGLDLLPVIVFDERTARNYLQNIATQIDLPIRETDLHLNGTEVVYSQGQTGRVLNIDATLANLLTQLSAFRDGEVPLMIEEQTPVVLEASAQAELLRQILSTPLTLTIADAQAGDPGPWIIQPADLAGMLTIEGVQTASGGQYQISFNAQALDNNLGQIAPLVNHSPQNARFIFNDTTRQLDLYQASATGRSLDLAASRDAILQKLLQGEHTIPLVLTVTQPAVGADATAASLGITGLVSSYTSYFRGSSGARLQNIQASASRFHGLLVPPNSTFSMADALGDISLENGYAEAGIIFNGRTITGVGGGVCQVSTTLYRAALYGGYPIVERHEHAYRVYYYEQTARGTNPDMAGLDATVYVPLVDLKFTNDRSTWLLMETYFSAGNYSLTWKFYSGDDGRTTEVTNHGLQNIVPAPEPRIEENPDLATGICKQVDYPGDGADIWVSRLVSRGGATLFTDNIYTHYKPWQAVYQYGPGTQNPQAMVAQGLCH